jgi:hypothetical protein
MRHAVVRERLSALLDGELPDAERARVERHLSSCAACRAELEELRRTVELLRGLPSVDVPPELTRRWIEGVRADAAGGGRGFGRWLSGLGMPLAAAAAGLAVVAVVQDVEIQLVWPRRGAPPAVEVAARPEPPAPAARVSEPPYAKFVGSGAGPAAPSVASRAPSVAPRAPAPRPSRAACFSRSPEDRGACEQWCSWLVGLAMEDAPGFLAEVDSLPTSARQRVMDLAFRSGSASLLAHHLRATGDPRASRLARRFERVAAVR